MGLDRVRVSRCSHENWLIFRQEVFLESHVIRQSLYETSFSQRKFHVITVHGIEYKGGV